MIKGSTIIFNEEYISEIERHISNVEKQLKNEITPDKRYALKEKLDKLNAKLEYALDFQDCLEEVLNVDILKLATVRTMSGLVLPLNIVKVI